MGRAKKVIRLNLETEIPNCRCDRESPLSIFDSLNRIIASLLKVATQIRRDLSEPALVIQRLSEHFRLAHALK